MAIDYQKFSQKFLDQYLAEQYADALTTTQEMLRIQPTNVRMLTNAAICCNRLRRFQDAIRFGLEAISIDPNHWSAHESLNYSYGDIEDINSARDHGTKVLLAKDQIAQSTRQVWLPQKTGNSGLNIIAFSLFGSNPRYCEPAILNCQERASLYPDWRCRFYIDDTVPTFVRQRLTNYGAELVLVDENTAKSIPGPMWRFLALDDPEVSIVIFRDADSVISSREVKAVDEWLLTDKAFHIMRDAPIHCELMLAGMWGARAGALPSMRALIKEFLKRPVTVAQFTAYADQIFLRDYVWPYARQNHLTHDSTFNIYNSRPFPDGPIKEGGGVGICECTGSIVINCNIPDGQTGIWQLLEKMPDGGLSEICSYPARVKNGEINADVPRRYALRLQAGELILHYKQ